MKRFLLLLLASHAFAQSPSTPAAAPDSIVAKRDLPYAGTDNPRQKLDLFLPAKRASAQPLPVIVFIHGGGWRNGDKTRGQRMVERFVASGEYAGVSVGYRLTDEAQWPAQIHDCKAAIRWIHGQAKTYGLDATRIGVWGSSAGGQLVSLLGTSGDVKELEGDLGAHTGESSRVACVVNYYGPQDFQTMLGQNTEPQRATGPLSLLFGGTPAEKPELARAASPVTHITRDDPPFLTAHGTEDPTVPYAQALELDAALKKAGVPHVLIEMTGGGHGFASSELDQRVKAFFDLHLRSVKAEISTVAIAVEARAPRR